MSAESPTSLERIAAKNPGRRRSEWQCVYQPKESVFVLLRLDKSRFLALPHAGRDRASLDLTGSEPYFSNPPNSRRFCQGRCARHFLSRTTSAAGKSSSSALQVRASACLSLFASIELPYRSRSRRHFYRRQLEASSSRRNMKIDASEFAGREVRKAESSQFVKCTASAKEYNFRRIHG